MVTRRYILLYFRYDIIENKNPLDISIGLLKYLIISWLLRRWQKLSGWCDSLLMYNKNFAWWKNGSWHAQLPHENLLERKISTFKENEKKVFISILICNVNGKLLPFENATHLSN